MAVPHLGNLNYCYSYGMCLSPMMEASSYLLDDGKPKAKNHSVISGECRAVVRGRGQGQRVTAPTPLDLNQICYNHDNTKQIEVTLQKSRSGNVHRHIHPHPTPSRHFFSSYSPWNEGLYATNYSLKVLKDYHLHLLHSTKRTLLAPASLHHSVIPRPSTHAVDLVKHIT